MISTGKVLTIIFPTSHTQDFVMQIVHIRKTCCVYWHVSTTITPALGSPQSCERSIWFGLVFQSESLSHCKLQSGLDIFLGFKRLLWILFELISMHCAAWLWKIVIGVRGPGRVYVSRWPCLSVRLPPRVVGACAGEDPKNQKLARSTL